MITQNELKKYVTYSDGKFIWKISPSKNIKVGYIAGGLDCRYYRITINKKRYQLHRLVWLYFHGKHPKYEIDHIDHDRSNNRIENLREVTQLENHHNMPLSKINKSGVSGVSWDKKRKRWCASIKANHKAYNLGRYINKNDAINARVEAKIRFNFHDNHA